MFYITLLYSLEYMKSCFLHSTHYNYKVDGLPKVVLLYQVGRRDASLSNIFLLDGAKLQRCALA